MAYSNQFYSSYLESTRTTFENIPQFPDFQAAVAGHGYGDTRIQQGVELHGKFDTVIHAHLDKRQSTRAKGKEMRGKFDVVFAIYASHVRRLKKEFAGDAEALAELKLTGPRDRRCASFIVQATSFYNIGKNNPTIFAKLQELGYTTESLTADLNGIKEYQTLRSEFNKLNGECQELVVEREKAYRMLKAWMDAFIATCKFVYMDNLQTLEKVGIFVRNQPIRKKTEEPAETDGGTADSGTADGGTADGGTADSGTTG